MTELLPVFTRLEIQIEGTALSRELKRKRGLADLARAKQRHRCLAGEGSPHFRRGSPGDHANCHIGIIALAWVDFIQVK